MSPATSPAPILSSEQYEQAWASAFVHSLDRHADDEIAWERDLWRELQAPGLAGLCDDLLAERRRDDFFLPADADTQDFAVLWQRSDKAAVLEIVRLSGLCLLAAARLHYWLGDTGSGEWK